MNMVSTSTLRMPIPNTTKCQILGPLLLIQVQKLGNFIYKIRRSPSAKRIVSDPIRDKEICWGPINMPMRPASFQILEDLARNYFNTRKRLYVVDGYAGFDK